MSESEELGLSLGETGVGPTVGEDHQHQYAVDQAIRRLGHPPNQPHRPGLAGELLVSCLFGCHILPQAKSHQRDGKRERKCERIED